MPVHRARGERVRAFRGWNNLGRSCQLRESTGDGLVPIRCRVPVTKGGRSVGVTHPRHQLFRRRARRRRLGILQKNSVAERRYPRSSGRQFQPDGSRYRPKVLMAKTGYTAGTAFGTNAISFDSRIG